MIDNAPLVRHVSEIRKAHPEIPHYLALKCQLAGITWKKQNEGCGSTDRRHVSDITRLSRAGRQTSYSVAIYKTRPSSPDKLLFHS